MNRAGAELHCADTGKAANDLFGGMIEQFKAAGAADERMKILERMMRGKNHKASELGKWVATGVPPYGYQKIGEKKEAKLTINETERAIVSRVYDMYLVHRGRNACRFFFHAVSGRPA